MKNNQMHINLSKQLSRAGLSIDATPKGDAVWKGLLEQVSRTYEEAEHTRQRLERDLRLANGEIEHLKNQIAALESSFVEANILLAEKQAELQHHKKSESLYKSVLSVSPDHIIITAMDGTILMLSPAVFKAFGYESNEKMTGTNIYDHVIPEDSGRARINVKLRLQEKLSGPVEYSGIKADVSVFFIDFNTDFIRDSDGEAINIVVAVRDITKRKQAEQALVDSRQLYGRLISNIPVGVYSMRSVSDGRFWIEYVSPRMFEMMGMSSGNLTSDINNAFKAIHPEEREGFARLHMRVIVCNEPFLWEGRTLVKGEVKWTRIESYPLQQQNGDTVWTGVVSDITERKTAEMALEESNRKLELLSITDGLTGIANRRHFNEALLTEYRRHTRSGSRLSLILLDIDHFKPFNDTYGHVHGDDCLRRVARVLAECASRTTDLPARYGGEEFACILPETDLNGATVLAEKIRNSIEALGIPNEGSKVADCVTASLGVLSLRPPLEDYALSEAALKEATDSIVSQVDKLLYKAKESGRNRIECLELQ